MGWTSSREWPKRADVVSSILRESNSPGRRILKHSLVGNHLWAAHEVDRAEGGAVRFVVLYLLEYNRDAGCYAYKDMDESMGPYYYDCPASVIKAAGPAPDAACAAWREKCAKHAESKKAKKSLAATIAKGDLLTFLNAPGVYRVDSLGPRPSGYRADAPSDYNCYTLPMRRLLTVTKPGS